MKRLGMRTDSLFPLGDILTGINDFIRSGIREEGRVKYIW